MCFGSQGTTRIFLLTKKSVVLADQKTGQVKASVPLPDLASVSVSTQSDGFFALKLKEVKRKACCGLSHFCQFRSSLALSNALNLSKPLKGFCAQSLNVSAVIRAALGSPVCWRIFLNSAQNQTHRYVMKYPSKT